MEFELDGKHFRAKKLGAMDQLHLSRRIAPLLPPLAPLIIEMEAREKATANSPLSSDIKALALLVGPFADALATMTDKDAEQVMTLTLCSVEIQTDIAQNAWMPLWIAGARMASVIELNDIAKLLPIVVRVIIFNLENFMDGLLTSRGEAVPVSNGGNSLAAKTGS